MRAIFGRLLVPIIALLTRPLSAQDLAPRAYVITPTGSNAINLTWSYYNGGVDFNGAIPISGATGVFSVPTFSYYHSFRFFGRSANVAAGLPYGVGTFQGELLQQHQSVYRSGLLDSTVRFSVNLLGGPAMHFPQFLKWKQKALLGASLKIVVPTGQYDPQKLVNWGINRWAFKPELGYSQRWGKWVLDGYAGVWFYTANHAYFDRPVPTTQTEAPIGSFEGHFSHDFKPGTWVSLDGNFWWGGVTSLSGIRNLATRQTGSRLGATVAFRVAAHHSIKVTYSDGTYLRFGSNYHNLQVGWQYSWLGWSLHQKRAHGD